MERGLRAFFYEWNYYLLPDGVTLDDLVSAGEADVKQLKEERCMAPDFLYERMEDRHLVISHPERAFEVRVNLYTGEEYDAVLSRHVDRVCPGCLHYEEDDTSDLEGHHAEMALDGTCYLRCGEDDAWSFRRCIGYFWDRISERLNDLAACIDAGDQEALNAIVNEQLSKIYVPLEFYGTVREGKYWLYLRGDWRNSPVACLTERALMQCAMAQTSPVRTAGWGASCLLPAHVVAYKSKFDTKCVGRLGVNAEDLPVLFLYIGEDDSEEERIDDFFRCMAEDVGEYAALCAIVRTEMTSDPRGMLSREELAKAVAAYAAAFQMGYRQAERFVSPYTTGYGYPGGADGEQLPYRRFLSEGLTQAPDVSLMERSSLVMQDGRVTEPWWIGRYSFIYLYLPGVQGDDERLYAFLWYLENVRSAPLAPDPEGELVAMNVGFGYGETEGFFFDFLVADENFFFAELRTLAPVMQACGVKMVVVNEQGVMAYDCGYTFTPVE